MKTVDEILNGLDCCRDYCEGDDTRCPYFVEDVEKCADMVHDDGIALIRRLQDENRALRTELSANGGMGVYVPKEPDADNHFRDATKMMPDQQLKAELKDRNWIAYWRNICELNSRQEAKGIKKYGEPLENNVTLTVEQRIEHAQEEAIDLLKYLEHLKQVAYDDGITANDYQRAAMRTANGMDYDWAPDQKTGMLINGVMGLNGEAGEVVDLVKKHLFQGHDLDKERVAEETGDVLWYCALIAAAIDMKLSDIAQMNIKKLKERFPDGFSKERSINRKEYQCENK